ncbi:hypothetical protein [Streptomyces malaysiensis]|uniref:Uncharacterized protein n=1 Tax=Streptomyces malaysiensis subsp. samsunensis TaxID=459658 RepID=A0A9X2M1R4_STRMQ|nr:hypothetical protein [Streptomyces samsunensis]MCQ8831814.1 hypothetical protein [Streptomyces samsunensis]
MARHPCRGVLFHYARVITSDPVAEADRHGAMADARIALCIANGVAIDDIDPSSGYDLSRRAYDEVRQSWREMVEQHGFNELYDRPRYEKAHAFWVERRPEFTAGDNWLEGIYEPIYQAAFFNTTSGEYMLRNFRTHAEVQQAINAQRPYGDSTDALVIVASPDGVEEVESNDAPAAPGQVILPNAA